MLFSEIFHLFSLNYGSYVLMLICFGILVGELEKLRKEWKLLETECHSLKKENVLLSSELQRQEKELHKYARTLFSFEIFLYLTF